jgi:hypothetical protein
MAELTRRWSAYLTIGEGRQGRRAVTCRDARGSRGNTRGASTAAEPAAPDGLAAGDHEAPEGGAGLALTKPVVGERLARDGARNVARGMNPAVDARGE